MQVSLPYSPPMVLSRTMKTRCSSAGAMTTMNRHFAGTKRAEWRRLFIFFFLSRRTRGCASSLRCFPPRGSISCLSRRHFYSWGSEFGPGEQLLPASLLRDRMQGERFKPRCISANGSKGPRPLA